MPLSALHSLPHSPEPAAPARELRQPPRGERVEFEAALARAGARSARGAAEPTLVRATRTRLSGSQAANALSAAWADVRGERPSAETLSLLVGQWAHETGRGAAMLNYNFGGIKGTGPSGLSTSYSTREGHGESEVRLVDRFRAYGSAEEGARDYVSLLARRYPDAVRAAERGDGRGFVQGLKAGGYFTDNEASYAASVQSLARKALSAGFDAIGAAPGPGAPAPESRPEPSPAALASVAVPAAPRPLAALPLDGGALLGGSGGESWSAPSISAAAFADEVNRAALLISALQIARPERDSHGEDPARSGGRRG